MSSLPPCYVNNMNNLNFSNDYVMNKSSRLICLERQSIVFSGACEFGGIVCQHIYYTTAQGFRWSVTWHFNPQNIETKYATTLNFLVHYQSYLIFIPSFTFYFYSFSRVLECIFEIVLVTTFEIYTRWIHLVISLSPNSWSFNGIFLFLSFFTLFMILIPTTFKHDFSLLPNPFWIVSKRYQICQQ